MHNQTLLQLKRWAHAFLGFIPQPLPKGHSEFDAFCDRLFDVYGLPSLPSYREAVATMILHLPPTTHRKSPRFFAKSIKKAMANQVAYSFLHPEKSKELEEKKLTQAATSTPQESVPA